jgi:hypothetical protein
MRYGRILPDQQRGVSSPAPISNDAASSAITGLPASALCAVEYIRQAGLPGSSNQESASMAISSSPDQAAESQPGEQLLGQRL